MTQSAPVQTDVLHFIVEDTAQNMWAVQMADSGTLTDFWTLLHRNSGLSSTVYDAFSAGVCLDCWDTPLVNVCIDDRHIMLKYRCADHQLAVARFTLQVGLSSGGNLSLKTFQQVELPHNVV